MNDLKNLIFALLEKCPNHAFSYPDGGEALYYYKDATSYNLGLTSGDKYVAHFMIYSGPNVFNKEVSLTEKEFMEMKWKLEDWAKDLEAKAFEEFKDFVESKPNSMDDLLND